MDLVKFLSPKHVILVHGEKPKMATLKGRIYSELGIQCDDPANNETVCIPSTHYVKAGASNTFIRSSLNPNFKFSRCSSEDESDSCLKDRKSMPWLQVNDERTVEGILVEEKSKKAKVAHQDELLLMLGEEKHEVQFAYCCPINIGNLEETKSKDLTSSNNVPCISDMCSWLRMLYIKLSDQLSGGNVQDFGEHIQVESVHVSICQKDRCPYRISDSSQNKSEAVFVCCTWSVADEKLAWKIISILENFNSGTY
jgi:integrator complex subunit 11